MNFKWDGPAQIPVILIVLLIGMITLYGLAYKYFGTFIYGSDGQKYYAQLRSIVVDRDLDMDNEFKLTPRKEVFGRDPLRTSGGKIFNHFSCGWAVFSWMPFEMVHFACKRFLPGLATGYTAPYDITFSLWVLFMGSLGLAVLSRSALKLHLSGYGIAIGALGAIFATGACYYLCVMPIMRHGPEFALLSILLACAIEMDLQPENVTLWICSSVIAFMLVLISPIDIIFLGILIPALWRTCQKTKNVLFCFRCGVIILCAIIAAYLFQLVWWRLMLGYWTTNAYNQLAMIQGRTGIFDWSKPRLLDMLIYSSTNGVFVYHPIYLLGFIGLITGSVFARNEKRVYWIAMLIISLLYTYVYSCSIWFHGCDSFGNRFFVNLAPYLLLGIASLYNSIKSKMIKISLILVIACCIIWNAIILLNYCGIYKLLPAMFTNFNNHP